MKMKKLMFCALIVCLIGVLSLSLISCVEPDDIGDSTDNVTSGETTAESTTADSTTADNTTEGETTAENTTECGDETTYEAPGALEFTINSDNESYSVSGIGTFKGEQLIIPSEYNGKPVTAIADLALSRQPNLFYVEIPASIEIIGNSSFYFTGIKSVIFEEGSALKGIGEFAFGSCLRLESIEIPYGVETIGARAFSGCIKLVDVAVPDSVTAIGTSVFQHCGQIRSLTLPFLGDSLNGLIGKKNIEYSFSENGSTSVPPSLQKVVLTKETRLGSGAFIRGSGIKSVVLNEGLETIGDSAFKECDTLIEVVIPNSVKTIGDGAFENCSSLESITLPKGLEAIGEYAFQNCSSLKGIEIPASVESIGMGILSGCSSVETVTVDAENNKYRGCENAVIHTESNTLVAGCNATKITDDCGVTEIAKHAFLDCKKLKDIEISATVTKIDQMAFEGCSSIESIVYKGTKEAWISALDGKSLAVGNIYTVYCSNGEIDLSIHG